MGRERRRKQVIDIALSIILIITIVSVIFYLYKIMKSPHIENRGYTATVTLVWRNVPKEIGNNIKIGDPIIIGNKPAYVVVDKKIQPYLVAVPTPESATIVPSKDTFNIYIKIRNTTPVSATIPPIGKDLALLGNIIKLDSYIWHFEGIVVNVESGKYEKAPEIAEPPQTKGCKYKFIARSVYPTVISQIKKGETIYDILRNSVMKIDNIQITHPYIYGWTKDGIKASPDPTKNDVILTLSPISDPIPLNINGKKALAGSPLEVRGKNWRVWGRILEVICP